MAEDVSRDCAHRLNACLLLGGGGIVTGGDNGSVGSGRSKRNNRSGAQGSGLKRLFKLTEGLVSRRDRHMKLAGFLQKGSPVRGRKALKFIDIEVKLDAILLELIRAGEGGHEKTP